MPAIYPHKEVQNIGRMEGGRQSRLLGRLLGKLRGEQSQARAGRYTVLDNHFSFSTVESGCGSTIFDEEDLETTEPATSTIIPPVDHDEFAANIDLRYGGQYLTPEQLPEFCEQLHHLVEVIRNIQSYSKIAGEYPSELERRLEQEAREVAALAAEARNARDVITRTRGQRRAVHALKKQLVKQLNNLRETEIKELESTIRLSDRKLFKNWESLKDTTDLAAFEPLLEEIRNKQMALDCLLRLIDNRRSALARSAIQPKPLPPPELQEDDDESPTTTGRKRSDSRRSSSKRKRKDASREPRSVPLSNEPSKHTTTPQVTLYISGAESAMSRRAGSAGAVALAPIDLPSRGSVRDILFFTAT